ncbi:unnamed protein product [Camellia sinensis]
MHRVCLTVDLFILMVLHIWIGSIELNSNWFYAHVLRLLPIPLWVVLGVLFYFLNRLVPCILVYVAAMENIKLIGLLLYMLLTMVYVATMENITMIGLFLYVLARYMLV